MAEREMSDLLPEEHAAWRAVIQPLFLKMYDEGVNRLTITREGAEARVSFTMPPKSQEPE
jgi:hypothetical protein